MVLLKKSLEMNLKKKKKKMNTDKIFVNIKI